MAPEMSLPQDDFQQSRSAGFFKTTSDSRLRAMEMHVMDGSLFANQMDTGCFKYSQKHKSHRILPTLFIN